MAPKKPYDGFPLRPHARGKWTIKINGQSKYFGKWADPYGALKEYEQFIADADDASDEGDEEYTLEEAVELFLEAKGSELAAGTLAQRTFDDYKRTANRFVDSTGPSRRADSLTPSDYSQHKQRLVAIKLGPTAVGNEISQTRVAMNWVYKTLYPDLRPQYGPDFVRPGRKSLRKAKAERGSRIIPASVVHALLAESGVHFRAMVLLGINAGFGPTDCGRLPMSIGREAITSGWMIYYRTKTYVHRECALWPETVQALHDSMTCRPTTKGSTFFVQANGATWETDGYTQIVSSRFRSAMRSAKLDGHSFYGLRHTFNTVAKQSGDEEAVRLVMGHVDGSMSDTYTHPVGVRSIEDSRLIAVSKRVRDYVGFTSAADVRANSPL